MAIVASAILEDAPLPDGRRQIIEAHTDSVGQVHRRAYLAEAGFDAVGQLAARAADLAGLLADREYAKNLQAILDGRYELLTTHHLTAAQLRSRLRETFREATMLESCLLATFLLTLTNAQLQALFSVSAGQVAALRDRLQDRADRAAAIAAATGE